MTINSLALLEKTLNREELLQKAKEVGELAEKYADQTDFDRKLPDEVMEKVKEAGFHKLLRPKAYGGQDLDYYTFGDIIRTVANYNVSAAWLTYFAIIHETWPAFLDKQGREELFGTGELMADVFAPIGKVVNDGEGYRISGTWNFCSGIPYCDWVALGAIHQLHDGTEPEFGLFIVHKKDFEIVENWDSLGLRGTGSNAVKLDNVYVPANYVFPVTRVVNGATAPDGNYEPDYQIFNVPYLAFFLAGFSHVAIGGVERLIRNFKEKTEHRVRIFNNNTNEKNAGTAQRTLAELNIQLTALKALAKDYADRLHRYQNEGIRVLDEEEREQLFAIRGYIAKTSAEMATRILITLGGNSVYKSDGTERFVRDILTVAAHPTHQYEDAMAGYGSAILGFKGHPTW
ncbi:p-hydroxyphenylacetate 3-hydroxylase, oxygenase component [Solibacillus isronensis B3W22]|uniref:p-hydroxyphenylacetate 3-hydroxylase, oxygenase component n=1 Tax=Solibacillus isronensis B3W22 TaxID=1224748 RepID=K1LGA6_9BACL|nr:acyl-CoA dehydrogenase family protein [Solibacillus isronensis]AMO87458.1 acyl-CoA dehydrogenase [Solibacillus silvestris]EKB43549.1 p-hydroxyphenylacetate 3-hydroxylase, oxygenase component [Solibacillus isronensis B3W22]